MVELLCFSVTGQLTFTGQLLTFLFHWNKLSIINLSRILTDFRTVKIYISAVGNLKIMDDFY